MKNAYKRKYDEMNQGQADPLQNETVNKVSGAFDNNQNINNQSNFPTNLYTPGQESYDMGYTSNPNNVTVASGNVSYTDQLGAQRMYDEEFKNAASEMGGAQSKVFDSNKTQYATSNPYAHPTTVSEDRQRQLKSTAEHIQRRILELDREIDNFLDQVLQLKAA